MRFPPSREGFVIAGVVALCTAIVAGLVVLDRYRHTWLALLVYACVYAVIALVERRTRAGRK
jgi:hypothetical protein